MSLVGAAHRKEILGTGPCVSRHSSTEGYAGDSGARPSCVSQSCTSK